MNDQKRLEEIQDKVNQAYWAQQYGQNEDRPHPLIGAYYRDVSWLLERYEALDSAVGNLLEELKKAMPGISEGDDD